MCYPAEFDRSGSNRTSVIEEICFKNLIPRFPPFKVIGTDTDRSATYYFVLTFHSTHGHISYCFRDKHRFHSKITNFHCVFNALAEGIPLQLGRPIGACGKKT